MQLKIIGAFPSLLAITAVWLFPQILLAQGVTMNMKLPATMYSTLIRRDLAKHWPRFHYPLMFGTMAANEMNGHNIGEQFKQFEQFNEEGSTPERVGKRAPLSAARFDRLLLGALLWPNLQRRRTRGVQHQQQQQYFAERPIRGTWRPAFHRTGGTILLGKRGGGEEEKRLFPLEMNREWPEAISAEESSWQQSQD